MQRLLMLCKRLLMLCMLLCKGLLLLCNEFCCYCIIAAAAVQRPLMLCKDC